MSSDSPNSPPLPGTSIPTLCRYCGETYSKLNVDHFSLIECPHCQCPDYQGKASRLQRALVDEKYKVFLAEKGEPDRSRMGSDVSHNRGETQTEAVSRNVINGVRQKISQERLGEKSPATPRAAEHTPYGRLYPALFQDVLAQIGKLNQEIQGLKDQNQSLTNRVMILQRDVTDLKAILQGQTISEQLHGQPIELESSYDDWDQDHHQWEPLRTPAWLDDYNHLEKAAVQNFMANYGPIEASLTQDSLSNDWVGRQEPIYFEENTSSSSYWFILVDPSEGSRAIYYSVLSKRKFRLTDGVIGPIRSSFLCRVQGEEDDDSFSPNRVKLSEFRVIYPAIVEKLPDSRWRLEQQGILDFPAVSSDE